MPDVEPLRDYLRRIAHAPAAAFEERLRAHAAAAGRAGVDPAAELERMRDFLTRYYEGVEPVSSYQDAEGTIIDCVPFEQQPAARAALAAGHAPLKGPPPSAGVPDAEGTPAPATAPAAEPDPAPTGTVKLPRLTLERLIRSRTPERVFHKEPGLRGDRD